ncbi:MAG TPA: DMT family transporter [Candidatus Dormibacteraeota bacterium]|nr:DMT family transporter [Candidatus Dormibacteraeota bacterium]
MLPEGLHYFRIRSWSRTRTDIRFTNGPSLRSTKPGYLLVVLSAFLFAAGGNAVKALFKLGYSPLVLSQLRIWWAFAWLVVILLTVRPPLLRVKLRELPHRAGRGPAQLLPHDRPNQHRGRPLVQYLGLVAVTAFERYHRRQAVPAQVWVALAMVLVGAFFAVGAYQPELFRVNLPGVMLGLVAAGFFAFYILRASTLARRLDTWTLLLYGFGAGSLLWAAFDVVSGTHLPTNWRIWVAMALLGLVGTLVAYGLFVLAVRTQTGSNDAGVTVAPIQ